MKTKIVLIGAGSASFSLALLRDAILSEGLQGSCMTLVDIDGKRLGVAYKLAVHYASAANAEMQFEKTTDRVEGMKGADFVICAVKAAMKGLKQSVLSPSLAATTGAWATGYPVIMAASAPITSSDLCWILAMIWRRSVRMPGSFKRPTRSLKVPTW